MFSECDVRRFPLSRGWIYSGISHRGTTNEYLRQNSAEFSSHMAQARTLPNLRLSSSNLASILIHKFSPCLHLVTRGKLCVHVLSGMLHSLSGFPVQISRGGDRLRFASLDILFLLLAYFRQYLHERVRPIHRTEDAGIPKEGGLPKTRQGVRENTQKVSILDETLQGA